MSHATWDEELAWFYTESGGDLGMRGTALEPSIRGDREPGPTDREVEAAAKFRRIAAAVYSLPPSTQRTLKLAHTKLPVALRPAFSKLSDDIGALIVDLYGQDRVLKACARKGVEGQKALADLSDSARDLAADAMRRYRAAKRAAEADARASKAARRAKWEQEWLR